MTMRGPAWQSILERALALLLLILLAPTFVLIAALIKLDTPGPCFSREPHVGWDGTWFSPLRFRVTESSRVTRVGRMLRRTSLDEMPELWNVLTGEMGFGDLPGVRPPWR